MSVVVNSKIEEWNFVRWQAKCESSVRWVAVASTIWLPRLISTHKYTKFCNEFDYGSKNGADYIRTLILGASLADLVKWRTPKIEYCERDENSQYRIYRKLSLKKLVRYHFIDESDRRVIQQFLSRYSSGDVENVETEWRQHRDKVLIKKLPDPFKEPYKCD